MKCVCVQRLAVFVMDPGCVFCNICVWYCLIVPLSYLLSYYSYVVLGYIMDMHGSVMGTLLECDGEQYDHNGGIMAL